VFLSWWCEEGPAVAAKLVDHAHDRGFIGVDYGTDLAELGRPSRLTIVFALLRDPREKVRELSRDRVRRVLRKLRRRDGTMRSPLCR